MTLKKVELPLSVQEHVVVVRQAVRSLAVEAGLSIIDQTKLVTAASELARNTVIYGGGGTAHLEIMDEGTRRGVRVQFVDQGPGIPDIELALRDGYTTGGGLGLGLGGARRLCTDFDIKSAPGSGTQIIIATWKVQR